MNSLWQVTESSVPSTACSVDTEDLFGPQVKSCLGGFDFTLLFEESILSIGPMALVLLLVPVRIVYLFRSNRKVHGGPLHIFKLVRKPSHGPLISHQVLPLTVLLNQIVFSCRLWDYTSCAVNPSQHTKCIQNQSLHRYSWTRFYNRVGFLLCVAPRAHARCPAFSSPERIFSILFALRCCSDTNATGDTGQPCHRNSLHNDRGVEISNTSFGSQREKRPSTTDVRTLSAGGNKWNLWPKFLLVAKSFIEERFPQRAVSGRSLSCGRRHEFGVIAEGAPINLGQMYELQYSVCGRCLRLRLIILSP